DMPSQSASTISHRMIFVAPVLAFAMAREENSNKFSFFLATHQCKQRSSTSDAGRTSKMRLMIGLQSRSQTRSDNPVYHVEWLGAQPGAYLSKGELHAAILYRTA